MASLFAPAFTVAVRMNPLWSALGAGMLGPSLVNDLGGEVRRFALAEVNRTSMTTVAAALVAVSEFTSHECDRSDRRPGVGAGDDARHDRACRPPAQAGGGDSTRNDGYGRGRSGGVHRRPGPVQREAAGSVPGHPDGIIRLSRSAIR
jgi:hypothetical protein